MKKLEILSILCGFFVALIISSIFLYSQGYNAIHAFSALLQNTFGSQIALSIWMYRSTILILAGLSASIIFMSGNVNLGQQGTFIIGTISTIVFGQLFNFHPIIQIPLILVLAMISACIWNSILIYFRFKHNMNEMIGSLMFNFIAKYLLSYLIAVIYLKDGATSIQTDAIALTSTIPDIMGFIFSILLACLLYFFIKNHRLGYEINLKGKNPLFTRLSGCSNKKITVLTTIISSSCVGMAGAFLLMGNNQHYYVQGMESNFGWDGVMMAMMASNNILLIPVYSLFFSILQTGSVGMEVLTRVPREFTTIFQAIMVFCVIATQEITLVYFKKKDIQKRLKNTDKEKK